MKKSKLLSLLLIVCVCISSMFMFGFAPAENIANAQEMNTQTTELPSVTGLGMGINVLTAQSVSDFKFGNSVLDFDALENLPKSSITQNENYSVDSSTVNFETLINEFDITFTGSANANITMLLSEFEASLSTAISVDYENYCYKYLNYFIHKIDKHKAFIHNYLNKATYANAFSEYFLQDLENLELGTLTIEEFFNRYGTHLAGSAIYGGRLKAFYTLISNTVVINSSVKSVVDAELSTIDAALTNTTALANITAAIETQTGQTIETTDMLSGFVVSSQGGSVIASNNLENFNTSYVNWCNSFDQVNNSVLVDYTADGLVPLWDIIPDEYAELAVEMENKFIELCDNAKSVFLDSYGMLEDFYNFNGGKGTVDEPYKIANSDHLKNIEKNMSAHFVLANDITMPTAQWKAIGGHYKKNYFTGVLDGNNYTIDGLKRTSNISESNNKFYFGLFGAIGEDGVVKDLNFTNVNIYIGGPSGNSNSRVFIGTVAGYCSGLIDNVTVDSDRVAFNLCTPGISFVGGIVGTADEAIIKNCEVNIRYVKSGRYSGVAGGIAGASYSALFENCIVTAKITASRTGYNGWATVGGICGETVTGGGEWTSEFINCTFSGTLETMRYNGSGGTSRKNEITNNGTTKYV